ncbi:MAG: lysozyme [bacterium]
MGTAEALDFAADLCIRFEGFSPVEYLCPAGVKTIGYGTTTNYPVGPITEAQGRDLLYRDLSYVLPSVLALCPVLDGFRLSAVLSWTYNLGVGRLRASTMRKRINEGDWESAAREMKRWNRANGRILRGLVIRRQVEAELFLR